MTKYQTLKLFVLLVLLFLWMGFIGPALVSASSWTAVVIGIFALMVWFVMCIQFLDSLKKNKE